MSSPSPPSSTQSTTQVAVPDWVATQVQQNLATADQLAAESYQAPDLPTVAPFNADQEAAFSGVQANAGSTTPGFTAAISGLTNLPASISSLLNPNLGAAESDTVSNLQRQGALTSQSLNAAAAREGALGGTRLGVTQGMVESGTEQAIGSSINAMSSSDYLTAMQNAFTEMMQTGSLTSSDQIANLRALAAESQVGSEEQEFTQGGYEDALSQWQQQQDWPYEQLAIEQSALAGSPYGSTVTSSQPYNTNPLASDLGLAATAIPALNTLAGWAGTSGLTTAAYNGLTSLGVAGTTGGAGTAFLESAGLFTPLAGDTAAAGTAAAGTAAAGGAAKGGADVAAAAPVVLAA